MKQFALVLILGSFCLCRLAQADTPPAPAPTLYTPSETTVAILPIISTEDSKVDALKDRHITKGQEELTAEFTRCGFKIADDASVQKALTDQKIDLSDEDNQRRAVFYQIGAAVHADLVVFVVIESVSRHNKSNSLFGQQKEGKALLKMWLVDADKQQPIINALQKEGKAASNAFLDNQIGPDTNGYTRYTIRAVGHGIDDMLADFFKPYPDLTKGAKNDKKEDKK